MTYQGRRRPRRPTGRGGRRALGGLLAAAAGIAPSLAEAPKRDFRGLAPGMTIRQAEAAASANKMTCETRFTGSTICRGGDASVVLVTTGRPAGRIYQLQVTLSGHYDVAAMRARLTRAYGLEPTTTPQVFETKAGQQFMLLEIGETSTIFYLTSREVLRDDSDALPPPKL